MMLNRESKDNNRIRRISTSDIDELAHFQINKNRRYTQLQSGVLQGDYIEINLGDVQIFREKLTAGTLVEATPVKSFVPFAAVLSNADNFNFCGKKRDKNTILQATGGAWDACFKDSLHFVVAAFDRKILSKNMELLTGQKIPSEWLVSKACMTDAHALNCYAHGLSKIIDILKNNSHILEIKNIRRMLCDTILSLMVNVMKPTEHRSEKHLNQPNRLRGVKRVIDYLHSYANEIPTIPELCNIANLSERNLQYGFKDYLGVTPIRYLRLVRLNGVRRELLLSHPKKDRIVDIALNWGFIELGRFAGEYRQLFQELPSTTLNNLNRNY